MVNEVNSVNTGIAGSSRKADTAASADPKKTQAPASSQTNSSGSGTSDTVQLSDQAKEIASIQRALAQLPEIDEAKVQEIREQIENGTYSIDVEALADKILADDQFFSG